MYLEVNCSAFGGELFADDWGGRRQSSEEPYSPMHAPFHKETVTQVSGTNRYQRLGGALAGAQGQLTQRLDGAGCDGGEVRRAYCFVLNNISSFTTRAAKS